MLQLVRINQQGEKLSSPSSKEQVLEPNLMLSLDQRSRKSPSKQHDEFLLKMLKRGPEACVHVRLTH